MIVGHSERRQYFAESDELVAAKATTKASATANTGGTAVAPAKASTKTAATVSADGAAAVPVAGAAKK